jgi:TolA-binding protein
VRGALVLLVAAVAGLVFYLTRLDSFLADDYAQAETLLEQGEYERAGAAFRQLYDRHPSFYLAPQALFQSGEVLNLYLKRYPEAVLAYLLVEKDYPDTELARKAQRQVAEIYKNRLGDYPRAIVAYQKLIDSGAAGADRLQYEVADAYFRQENYEQARIEFEALAKGYPDSQLVPEAEYRAAVAWSLEGRPREAEAAFRHMIERWPDSPYAAEAGFSLATLLEERGELAEALRLLEGLTGSYPSTEALAKKIERVRDRNRSKRKGT